MKHLFVPYELSLIAKEKGFNEPCLAMFDKHNEKDPLTQTCIEKGATGFNEQVTNENLTICIAAPLYQQLIDWFREKYELVVFCEPRIKLRGYAYCPNVWKKHALHFPDPNSDGGYMMYKDYYKALNRAITEAFKLIK